jgi:hypothetical protein
VNCDREFFGKKKMTSCSPDCQGDQIPGKKVRFAGQRWLMSVILATQEAEIRRIAVQSQFRQIVHKTLS